MKTRFLILVGCCVALLCSASSPQEEQWKTFLSTSRSLEELQMKNSEDFFGVSPISSVELALAGPPGFRFPVVEIQIGGETLLAIFDTGAGSSLITVEAALRTGVVPVGRAPQLVPAVGFGGTGVSVAAVATSMQWGGADIARVRFSVIADWKALEMEVDGHVRRVEAILGYDLMLAYDWVDVLPAERTIRLGRGIKPPSYPKVSHALLPPASRRGPQVEASLENGKRFPVTLDTGGHFVLRVPEPLADALGLRRRDYVSLPTTRVSATGHSATYRGMPTALNIGELRLDRLAVDIATGNEEANERIGALLGNPVLSRLRWSLDHRSRQIHFQIP